MVEAGVEGEPLPDDGHQDIDRDGDPDLRLHSGLSGAVKGFNAQVLLDPFEEQFHLPALLVDLCDGQGRKAEVIGHEDQAFVCFSIVVTHFAQRIGIGRGGLKRRQNYGLIRAYARALIHWMRVAPLEQNIGFGAHHEQCRGEREDVEASKSMEPRSIT